jgi:CheY-like chemotaxis protein
MPRSRPARVLIVDDSEEATQLLSLLVGRRGHHVRVAHDVEGALRVAKEFEPDVALLDIMIRHESGFFLARELRELPGLESCRLIAMSGFELDRHHEISEAVGFGSQLSKPIDPARLFEAIEAQDDRP